MSLTLACYSGYVNAPDIRICSPSQRPALTSNDTSDTFDDLLAGCSYVFTSSTNPTEQWVRENFINTGDAEHCKNFQYFSEGGRLEATIAIQSSPYLTELIDENKSQIRTLLYIAVVASLVIVLFRFVEYFRPRCVCHYPFGGRDEVDAAKKLLPY